MLPQQGIHIKKVEAGHAITPGLNSCAECFQFMFSNVIVAEDA